jgi:hypothetical protein
MHERVIVVERAGVHERLGTPRFQPLEDRRRVLCWPPFKVFGKKLVPTMANKWLATLKEDGNKHNTAAALREDHNLRAVGPAAKPKTPINPPSKTSNTPKADQLGLVATWSGEFGYISLHDPTTGEWHDVQTKDAPGWAKWEASKRKELYRAGNRKAYRLTSREMGEVWEAERSAIEEEIVEEYPVEEEDEIEEGKDS